MKANRFIQIVAWGILILLVAVPPLVFSAVREANSWWIIWSVISVWVVLDSMSIASSAFPERVPHDRQSVTIIVLGVLNLLASLFAVLLPATAAAGK